MAKKPKTETDPSDPAAVFGAALSLWQACNQRASGKDALNLSECYNGMDQFMREVMRVANLFEEWACSRIEFDELPQAWPYLLEGECGESYMAVIMPSGLAEFDDSDCLRVALRLRLPIKLDDKLPIPVDVMAPNPIAGSEFRKFRIQTVRESTEDHCTAPYVPDDEPFDERFGAPFFGLYGVDDEGMLEHIADFGTYSAAVSLARKLAPGVAFPASPTFADIQSPE